MSETAAAKLGGFRSGFDWRVIPRGQAKFGEYIICNHNCGLIVQLISRVSGEPEFELCPPEARKMAAALLAAAGHADVVGMCMG